jgi:hypothetical protein
MSQLHNQITKTHNTISHPCHYCMNKPGSHSFSLVTPSSYIEFNELLSNETGSSHTYKTIIANASLYNDPSSIIYHIDIELKINKTANMDYWEWEIDFEGAGVKHYLAFRTVRELSKWINSEKDGLCKNLKNIKIKNAGIMIKPMIGLSKWFLPEHINVVCL